MTAIDLDRLRADLRALAHDLVQVKRLLRAPWTRPMHEEQRRLWRLRRRATELHVLHAWRRGRQHLAGPPRAVRDAGLAWDAAAWHARIAERVAAEYAAPSPSEASR